MTSPSTSTPARPNASTRAISLSVAIMLGAYTKQPGISSRARALTPDLPRRYDILRQFLQAREPSMAIEDSLPTAVTERPVFAALVDPALLALLALFLVMTVPAILLGIDTEMAATDMLQGHIPQI